jgi:hypothetical protein
VNENAFVVVAPAASVTWSVAADEPAAFGVPVMRPFVPSVRPPGSDPDAIAHT